MPRTCLGKRSQVYVVILALVGCFSLGMPQPVTPLDSLPSVCSSDETCYRNFLDSFSSTSSPARRAEIVNFLNLNAPDSQWAKRAVLRYGYGLKDSFPAESLTYLERAVDEFPGLTDYLNFWIGQAYEKLENWQQAAGAFQKVSRMGSNTVLAGEGRYRAGLMLAKSHDCPQALDLLASALAAVPGASQAPSALWAMGHCAVEQGRVEDAIKLSRELWWHYPQSPESRKAEEWLRSEPGSEGFVPSSVERYQRGMAFYGAGLLEEAVGEFGHFLSQASPGPQVPQAQYHLALALTRLKRYPEAESILTRLAQSDSSRRDEAWIWLGRVYLRQGKGEQLSQLTGQLSSSVLAGDQQALIWIFHGIWLEDHDRYGEASESYKRAAKVAHTQSQKLDALWRFGWILYQREEFSEAAGVFEEIATVADHPDSESVLQTFSQAVYWWARSEQHLKQEERAMQRFHELANGFPYTYYGQLAKYRLSSIPLVSQPISVTASEPEKAQDVPVLLLKDPHYGKVYELYELGLFDEATLELQELYRRYGSQPQAFQPLVSLAVRVKAYDLGIRLAIRHFGSSLRKGELPPTSDAWLGAFPIGYQNLIQEVAPQDLDPYLVAGLIREESLYNSRARSGVGAMGLMQLMPATAKRVAHQVGMPFWGTDSEALFHPERNIRLGSWYLGELIQDFQGNLVYAVASYNAGPSAVKRWIEKNGQRPLDEFIELIGYRETRGYVKRVLGSYWIYRTVLSAGCPRISLDTFC